ncbi:hypothetical protein GH5_01539 [Leishmania sp. Ghana 2012 LV757]|uniref:hypothetical protein n=1 Tax=Leishmania sp. Ghana 2012 LV757 TaxID=2803181 RepID=UPI001B6C9803|nr:hypothetical protein GH5_01539 [Leishmania sp. Ghana 2012 LV757]
MTAVTPETSTCSPRWALPFSLLFGGGEGVPTSPSPAPSGTHYEPAMARVLQRNAPYEEDVNVVTLFTVAMRAPESFQWRATPHALTPITVPPLFVCRRRGLREGREKENLRAACAGAKGRSQGAFSEDGAAAAHSFKSREKGTLAPCSSNPSNVAIMHPFATHTAWCCVALQRSSQCV